LRCVIVHSCLPGTGDLSRCITVETICSKHCSSLLLWRSPWRQDTKQPTLPLPKIMTEVLFHPHKVLSSLDSFDPGRVCSKVATVDKPCRRNNTVRLSIITWWLLGNELSPILTCSSMAESKCAADNELL